MSGTLHIHAPPATGYYVSMKRRGCRKFREISQAKNLELAKKRAVELLMMQETRAVRIVAAYEWYDPSVIFEVTRDV